MDHIQELQRKRQEQIDHIRSTFTPTTNVETLGEITAEQLSVLEKAKKIAVFTPEAIKQIEIALNKAEDTGFWKGEKVTKGTVDKAKKAIEKLEKKVVTDKNGGTKTVYISVKNETKAHHKMSKEELMEHHSSKELHDIADNYSKSHADVKSSVEKNGAADDSYKSQGATHKRDDVASSEQYYMHIKGAAYEKEKSEGKAQEKATKEVNQPVEIEEDTVEKGGAGSGPRKGSSVGKVIGYTKSGKTIHDTHHHPDHADFSQEDHIDAIKIHRANYEKSLYDGKFTSAAGKAKMFQTQEAAEGHRLKAVALSKSEDDVEKGELSAIEKAFQDLSGHSNSVNINGQTFFKGEDDDLGDFLEKAKKDLTKLTQRRIIDKNGVGRIVWVKTGEDGKETDFESGHKVTFDHKGEKKSGIIKNLKHSKDDQYGTAEVHDEQGNKYSKSLLTLSKHDKEDNEIKGLKDFPKHILKTAKDAVDKNSKNNTDVVEEMKKMYALSDKDFEKQYGTTKTEAKANVKKNFPENYKEVFGEEKNDTSLKDMPSKKTGYGETGKVSKDGTKMVLTPNGDFQKVDAKTGKKVEEKPATSGKIKVDMSGGGNMSNVSLPNVKDKVMAKFGGKEQPVDVVGFFNDSMMPTNTNPTKMKIKTADGQLAYISTNQISFEKDNASGKITPIKASVQAKEPKKTVAKKDDKSVNPPILSNYDPDDFSWSAAGGGKELKFRYNKTSYVGVISGDLVDKVLDRWVDGKSAKHSDVLKMVSQLKIEDNIKKAFEALGVDTFEK